MADISQWWMLVKTLGALALILGLIFGLSYLAKRYFQPGKFAKNFSKGLRVIQSLPLNQKSKLILVEVEGRKLLIGLTQGHICSLKDFGEEQAESIPNFEASLNLAAEGKYVREA